MVELNEVSSIFQKSAAFSLQTPENFKPPYNPFKRQINVRQWLATRGRYVHVHKPIMVKISGASQKCYIFQFSQNMDGFRQNDSQGFSTCKSESFRIHIHKQIPIENIFIFTIYQNYTLADSSNFWKQKVGVFLF